MMRYNKKKYSPKTRTHFTTFWNGNNIPDNFLNILDFYSIFILPSTDSELFLLICGAKPRKYFGTTRVDAIVHKTSLEIARNSVRF